MGNRHLRSVRVERPGPGWCLRLSSLLCRASRASSMMDWGRPASAGRGACRRSGRPGLVHPRFTTAARRPEPRCRREPSRVHPGRVRRNGTSSVRLPRCQRGRSRTSPDSPPAFAPGNESEILLSLSTAREAGQRAPPTPATPSAGGPGLGLCRVWLQTATTVRGCRDRDAEGAARWGRVSI